MSGGVSHEGRRGFSPAAWQHRLDAVDLRKVRARSSAYRNACFA
jgi:hypothetical protein